MSHVLWKTTSVLCKIEAKSGCFQFIQPSGGLFKLNILFSGSIKGAEPDLVLARRGSRFWGDSTTPPSPSWFPLYRRPFLQCFSSFLGGLLFLRMGGAVCVATFCCEGDGAGRGGSGAGPAPLPTGVIWVWKEIISLILIYFFWESPLMRISFLTNCFASASKWNNYVCKREQQRCCKRASHFSLVLKQISLCKILN